RSAHVIGEPVDDACRRVACGQREWRAEIAVAHGTCAIVRVGDERLVADRLVRALAAAVARRRVEAGDRALPTRRTAVSVRTTDVAEHEDAVGDVGVMRDARPPGVELGLRLAPAERLVAEPELAVAVGGAILARL